MLHIINKPVCEALIAQHDGVLLLGDAVYQALPEQMQYQNLLQQGVCVYVLSEALSARGLASYPLIDGIKIIDYPSFVDLIEHYTVVHSW